MSMKQLKDILEGIFDVDDNIDNIDAVVAAQEWWEEQKKQNKYLGEAIINGKGEITVPNFTHFEYTRIPSHIKLVNNGSIRFRSTTIERLDSIKCDSLELSQVIVKDFGKNHQYKKISIYRSECNDYSWLPNTLEYLSIECVDDTNLDLLNKHIGQLRIYNCDYANISNINCGHWNLSSGKKLKNIHNILCDELTIYNCKRLSTIDGTKSIRQLYINGCHDKLKPEQLPSNISIIRASKQHEDWLKDNLVKLFPNLNIDSSDLPDPQRFKWKNVYKEGSWVVAKSKSKHSSWGSSRGTLMIDKIVKVTPSGSIRCEKAGVRPYTDVELMRYANKNKNWDYKDPNGLNDITGVGIEVGDEVVVYRASGSYGVNNGIAIDTITSLTKAMVRCKNAGLRSCDDICILRSQKECNKQFK